MDKPKEVAVLVRRNQGEALRVAAGLTLAGNSVDVYILGQELGGSDDVLEQMEMLELADIYPIRVLEDGEVGASEISPLLFSERLLLYDAVLAL